jgi:hypothetical protein
MVAVFSGRISIDYNKNQISNPEDIVWAWNDDATEISHSSSEMPFCLE